MIVVTPFTIVALLNTQMDSTGQALAFRPTLSTVSGAGFEIIYDNVIYESTWPIERWIKRNIVVRNASSENLKLDCKFIVQETGEETEPWGLFAYLEPGECDNVWYYLDVSHRTGLTPHDMEIAADHTFTVIASVWPHGNESAAVTVKLNHLVHVVPVVDLIPNSTVRGHVYDKETGTPIAGAAIFLRGADSIPQYGATSASDGSYSLEVYAYRYLMTSEPHRYDMRVESPGYKTVHRPLEPIENDILEVDIYMERQTATANYVLVDNYQTNLTIYKGDVTPDERRLVISQGHVTMNLTEEEIRQRSRIYLFDISGDKLDKIWDYPIGDEAWAVDISDDGKYVVATLTYDGKIVLLNENGAPLWIKDLSELPGDPTNIAYTITRAVRISHNNKYVAVSAGWGWLYLLDLQTGDLKWWTFVRGHIRRMEFSSDDRYIYAGSGAGLYKIDIDGKKSSGAPKRRLGPWGLRWLRMTRS